MRVIFNMTLAGVNFVFSSGKTYDLEDEKAEKWIKAGLCRPAAGGSHAETASAPPPVERADAKPKSKPKSRANPKEA